MKICDAAVGNKSARLSAWMLSGLLLTFSEAHAEGEMAIPSGQSASRPTASCDQQTLEELLLWSDAKKTRPLFLSEEALATCPLDRLLPDPLDRRRLEGQIEWQTRRQEGDPATLRAVECPGFGPIPAVAPVAGSSLAEAQADQEIVVFGDVIEVSPGWSVRWRDVYTRVDLLVARVLKGPSDANLVGQTVSFFVAGGRFPVAGTALCRQPFSGLRPPVKGDYLVVAGDRGLDSRVLDPARDLNVRDGMVLPGANPLFRGFEPQSLTDLLGFYRTKR